MKELLYITNINILHWAIDMNLLPFNRHLLNDFRYWQIVNDNKNIKFR